MKILFLFLSLSAFASAKGELVADAGKDAVKLKGEKIILSGNSESPEGVTLGYEWAMISRPTGSKAILSNPVQENPSFIADFEGIYIIRLRVSDGSTTSDHDDVVIRVIANSKPIALVGADQSVQPGQTVQISAASSFDLEQQDLTYLWSIDIAPEGSHASLFSPKKEATSFTADLPGLYLVRVSVSDQALTDEAFITIRAEGEIVLPPRADAGEDQVTVTGELLTLDGSNSGAEGDGVLTYSWVIERSPVGSRAVLQNPTSSMPGFTPDLDGDYIISLQVNDGSLTSSPDLIEIVAQKRPQALIQANSLILKGSTVILDGSESFDPGGGDISYSWTLDQKPKGSSAVIVNPESMTAIFSPDLPGDYIISLVVGSEHLSSLSLQYDLKVAGEKEQKVLVGSFVEFGRNTFQGGDGEILGWEIIAKPSSSEVTLVSDQGERSGFRVDASGTYIIRWRLAQNEKRFEDYSLVHAYSSSGPLVFGPVSFLFDPLCFVNIFLRGCKDMTWDLSLTDLTKNYALEIEYENIETGFVFFNEKLIAGRYDFLTSGAFVSQVDPLSDNILRATFLQSGSDSSATLSLREMAFSGSEADPPSLSITPLEVRQGETGTGQVSVSDIEGSMHTYSLLTRGLYGEAEIDSTGQLSYTADGSYLGSDLVFIQVQNDTELSQIIAAEIKVIEGDRK